MLASRSAAVIVAGILACARPEPTPPEPTSPEPSSPKPRRPVAAPVGVRPELLARAGLTPGDPEAKCRADGPHFDRCLQARAHPEVVFFWTLSWDRAAYDAPPDGISVPAPETLARRERVIARLQADGAREIPTGASTWSVDVVASYDAVRGAMGLPEVQSVEVHCTDDEQGFCACERLRVDECAGHAFCRPVFARTQRPEAACVGPRALVGCTRADLCNDAMTLAHGPDRRVWLFSSSCLPDQPGWQRIPMKMDMPLALRKIVAGPYCPEPGG